MSEHNTIREIEEYIKKLLHNIHLDSEEKREVEEEWKQHLYDHYYSLLNRGIVKSEAIQEVITQFGDIPMLQQEINETYPSSIKNHVQKEIAITVLCLVASMVGPWLLIGAQFQAYFITVPIVALVIAYLANRFVVKKQTYWLFSIIGITPIYLIFVQLLQQILGEPLSLNMYLGQLFSLNWDRLTGQNGLFEYTTLHMMWYVVIAVQIISTKNYVPIWQKICNASYRYWAMLLIGLLLARWQSNAEFATIYLNVFLLYAFLQQIISVNWVVSSKEKINRLLSSRNL